MGVLDIADAKGRGPLGRGGILRQAMPRSLGGGRGRHLCRLEERRELGEIAAILKTGDGVARQLRGPLAHSGFQRLTT